MILVKRLSDGTCRVLSGNIRLRTELENHSGALVRDADTQELLDIHDVGGRFFVLDAASTKRIERMAEDIINAAKEGSR